MVLLIEKEIWDAYMVYRHMARLHLKKFQYGQVCVVRINPKLRNLLEDGEYIPSLGQLNLMAHYMDELNKAFTYVSASPLSSTWYWSSTESSQAVAWYVVFSSGLTGTGNKYNSDRVRTVIDF